MSYTDKIYENHGAISGLSLSKFTVFTIMEIHKHPMNLNGFCHMAQVTVEAGNVLHNICMKLHKHLFISGFSGNLSQ